MIEVPITFTASAQPVEGDKNDLWKYELRVNGRPVLVKRYYANPAIESHDVVSWAADRVEDLLREL